MTIPQLPFTGQQLRDALVELETDVDGKLASDAAAELRDRATHTGTQSADTISGLATVATSGAYADLSGVPTLGTAASTDAADYATAAQGALAESALQPGDLPGDLSGVVTTEVAGLAPATGFGVIAYNANTQIDFTVLNGQVNTIELGGSLSLTGTGYVNGVMLSLRLIAGGAERTLTISGDWVPVGDSPPATIPANKVAIFSAWCFGVGAADVVYGIAIQP